MYHCFSCDIVDDEINERFFLFPLNIHSYFFLNCMKACISDILSGKHDLRVRRLAGKKYYTEEENRWKGMR